MNKTNLTIFGDKEVYWSRDLDTGMIILGYFSGQWYQPIARELYPDMYKEAENKYEKFDTTNLG